MVEKRDSEQEILLQKGKIKMMTPYDMLGIRNKVDAALKAIGWEFSGGGV